MYLRCASTFHMSLLFNSRTSVPYRPWPKIQQQWNFFDLLWLSNTWDGLARSKIEGTPHQKQDQQVEDILYLQPRSVILMRYQHERDNLTLFHSSHIDKVAMVWLVWGLSWLTFAQSWLVTGKQSHQNCLIHQEMPTGSGLISLQVSQHIQCSNILERAVLCNNALWDERKEEQMTATKHTSIIWNVFALLNITNLSFAAHLLINRQI